MRRILLSASLLCCLAWPSMGLAQDADTDEGVSTDAQGEPAAGESAAQEQAVGDDGGYEPDQRGAEEREETPETGTGGSDGGGESTGGDLSTGATEYEPDQRGAEDDDEADAGEAASMEPASEELQSVYRSDSAARGGLGFELQLHLGGGLTGLQALGGNNLVQSDQGDVFGGSFGLTAGLGIGPLTIGPRVSLTAEPNFLFGAVGLDVQVALTSGAIAPMFRLTLSYAFMAGLSDPLPSQNDPAGFWGEFGLGVRARIAGPFILGGDISAGYLALFRGEVPECVDRCDEDDLDLDESGASHGITLRFHVFLGLSF